MDINQKIKDLRKSKKLSQKDLAIKMGVAQPTINYFESRGKDLTVNQLESIANGLGVSVKELLFDEKEEKTDSNLVLKEIEDLRNKNAINEKLLKDTINHTLDSFFMQCIFGYAMQTVGLSKNDLDLINKPPTLEGHKSYEIDVTKEEKAIILRELVKKDLLEDNIKPEYESLIFNFFLLSVGNDLDYFFEKKYIENKMYFNMYKYYKETIKPKFGM